LWLRHFGLETTLREARRYFVRRWQKPETRQSPLPLPRERAVHPFTGQRIERLYLGACLTGRLMLYRTAHTPAIVVVWEGRSPIGAFDPQLRRLAKPKPLPAPTGRRAVRLLRLAAGSYAVGSLEHGGYELFAVFMPPPPPSRLRRPQF
jgi:hypothetical protein